MSLIPTKKNRRNKEEMKYSESVRNKEKGTAKRGAGTGSRLPSSMSIYLHIPFCVKKCRYCDFLSGPQGSETRERYVRCLITEIRIRGALISKTPAAERAVPVPVDTIFIGGGTPSVLSGDQICRIMEAVREAFKIENDAEITMEMNPGTLRKDSFEQIRAAGANRLSVGVQSFLNEELRLLGRIHTREEAEETVNLAREAGFDNINIDLMSALPGQTMEKWADTLKNAVRLGPDHISAYSLILEPGTELESMMKDGSLPPLPDEETERAMFHYTKQYLEQNGYMQYEISNFARPGRACRHNTGYWTGHSYLGMGIGAASYMDGSRFSNTDDLNQYLEKMDSLQGKIKSCNDEEGSADGLNYLSQKTQAGLFIDDLLCGQEKHRLSVTEKMEEFMFLGLRMTQGVRSEDFSGRFHRSLDEVYGDVIRKHLEQGVLIEVPGGYRLSMRGIDVSNYVLADYLFS